MKKLIFAAAALAALSLTGCSSASTQPVFTTPTFTAPTTEYKQAQAPENALYLQSLRSKYPLFNSVSDDTLVGAGREVCSNLNSGASVDSIVSAGLNHNIDASMWGYQIGLAVGFYCPEYSDKVRAFSKRYGG